MSTATAETTPVSHSLGAISVDEIYPLPLFQRLSGLSSWAMRQARRRGLRMTTVGRRKFVTGRAWSEYLESATDVTA